MSFQTKCKESYELINKYLNDELELPNLQTIHKNRTHDLVKRQIIKSMDVLMELFTTKSLNEISVSYNGGKDCLVMVVLILATIHKSKVQIPSNFKLASVYIDSESPFPAVSDFITKSTKLYHLNSITIRADLKLGFETYLKTNPNITTVIVGIRYSDPYGSQLLYKQPTDHNWPTFLRYHPMLHWHYIEIWDFILTCKLKYCHMYDLGYTSLGGIHSTLPNPKLKTDSGFLPAYMLIDDADEYERLGRNVTLNVNP